MKHGNTKNRLLRTLALLALTAFVLFTNTGCCGVLSGLVDKGTGLVEEGADSYNTMIALYQGGQREAANGSTCIALSFGQINTQVQLSNNYLVADVEKTRAYRESLATFGSQFQQQQEAYTNPDGTPKQPSDIDLAELVNSGATPADMALTIQVFSSHFVEAPLAQVDSEPVINAQRIISEQFNQAFACTHDWNAAVEAYNVHRNQISGDVVGRVVEALGIKELPQELPYFVMQAPSVVPTVPALQP